MDKLYVKCNYVTTPKNGHGWRMVSLAAHKLLWVPSSHVRVLAQYQLCSPSRFLLRHPGSSAWTIATPVTGVDAIPGTLLGSGPYKALAAIWKSSQRLEASSLSLSLCHSVFLSKMVNNFQKSNPKQIQI